MRWPPNKAWTSLQEREGYRHFEVKTFGGKRENRWVDLFPVNNQKILLRILWSELKSPFQWKSGWMQLPKPEDEKN